nr:tyrosine-type recombinase/integrase [Sphingomonas hengshuiensis]
MGALLRAIDGYEGQPSVALALRIAPHVFVRPGELRAAEWGEFDLSAKVWTIPGEKMKRGRPHRVPLSKQILALLAALRAMSGSSHMLRTTTLIPQRKPEGQILGLSCRSNVLC